jgi:hypothetical protein
VSFRAAKGHRPDLAGQGFEPGERTPCAETSSGAWGYPRGRERYRRSRGLRLLSPWGEAIRRVFPEYDAAKGYKAKIVLPPNLLDEGSLNVFSVTIVTPERKELSKRLATRELLQIVAASNFKQRTRTALLYYYAELHNYAVMGTAKAFS